jgi:hypothetical protein
MKKKRLSCVSRVMDDGDVMLKGKFPRRNGTTDLANLTNSIIPLRVALWTEQPTVSSP